MKKFFKFTFILVIVVLVLAGGFWAYINYFTTTKNTNSMSLVPNDAIIIVETSNLSKAWSEVSNSEVWAYMQDNKYFNDLNSDIESLNKYLKENKVIKMILEDRNLTLSIHMISAKDWDFLFVVDLKKSSNILKGGLKEALGFVDGFKVSKREYKGYTIIELADEENPLDIIYLLKSDNLLLAGFSGALIEKAIDQKDDLYWQNNKNLKLVSEKLTGKNLFRMFVNYSQVNPFTMSYLTEESESVKMLTNSLRYSVFDINLEDDMLSFKGYTDIDSLGSYVKALANVKPGKLSSWEILSNQTSLYFAMSFDNYNSFYTSLINQYKEGNAQDMEDIEHNIQLLEKYLKISMQDDFFSWIGTEISFAKLRPNKNTRLEDVLVIFKANDISNAKRGLDNILKRIKGRTPVKFEKEVYKNYEIFQLQKKGFFKPFFGKMFKNMEKPYFTYIEDYVVFSNSIETLKTNIDDFIIGATLSHDSNFEDFKDEFNAKSNLTVFIRTPKIYENLYYYSNRDDRESIKENREFILSFSQIGFQLTSEDNMFNTLFMAKHNPDAFNSDKLETFEKETSEALFRSEVDSLTFKYFFAENTFPEDTFYVEYYPESEKIKYEGKISENMPQGLWKTYYKTGNIQNSVNYEKGIITGEAFFFYDANPKVTRAEVTFEEDKIVGNYFEYYPNGAQKAKILYKDGISDGEAIFYYPNGKLKINAEYKNGLKSGKWEFFDEKGNSIGKEKWKKGVKKK